MNDKLTEIQSIGHNWISAPANISGIRKLEMLGFTRSDPTSRLHTVTSKAKYAKLLKTLKKKKGKKIECNMLELYCNCYCINCRSKHMYPCQLPCCIG